MAAAKAAAPDAAAVQACDGDNAAFRDSGRTVIVSADLLDRIVKRVDVPAEAVRRQNEFANMCGGCRGEPDCLAEYEGEFVRQRKKARVCERCLEDTVIRKHGVDVHARKHSLNKLACLRRGEDVTPAGGACALAMRCRRVKTPLPAAPPARRRGCQVSHAVRVAGSRRRAKGASARKCASDDGRRAVAKRTPGGRAAGRPDHTAGAQTIRIAHWRLGHGVSQDDPPRHDRQVGV